MKRDCKFEIYESLDKRQKKYAVVPVKYQNSTMENAIKYMMRLNHCSAKHILLTGGYILNGKLFFDRPDNKKAKPVYVLTYIR